jgi:hypothetical protein
MVSSSSMHRPSFAHRAITFHLIWMRSPYAIYLYYESETGCE